MTNDVRLNAEFDLQSNQDDKELFFNLRKISIKHHFYIIKPW